MNPATLPTMQILPSPWQTYSIMFDAGTERQLLRGQGTSPGIRYPAFRLVVFPSFQSLQERSPGLRVRASIFA